MERFYAFRVSEDYRDCTNSSHSWINPSNIESFHEELITRASHNHPNFVDDNGMVLDVLVSCLKTTRHMSDLKPFQKRRDVRGALAALELHNTGNSK